MDYQQPSPFRAFMSFVMLSLVLGTAIGQIHDPIFVFALITCGGVGVIGGFLAMCWDISSHQDIVEPADADRKTSKAWLYAFAALGIVAVMDAVVALIGRVMR